MRAGWKTLGISAALHIVLGVVIATQVGARAPHARPGAQDGTLLIDVVAVAPPAAPPPRNGGAAPAVAASSPLAMSSAATTRGPRGPGVRSSVPTGRVPEPGTSSNGDATNQWMKMRGGKDGPDDRLPIVPLFGGRAARNDGAFVAPADPGLSLFDFAGIPEPKGKALMQPSGNGTYRHERAGFGARVARDGRVTFRDKNLEIESVGFGKGGMPLGISGRFDLTDWAMRSHGEDPYQYEKAKFLAETQDERMAMAAEVRTENLRAALRGLPAYLRAVWKETRWSAAERRRAIFQLWDDCLEAGDAEIVRAATAARATVMAFVRRELPAGSADAYPAHELESLNAHRASQQPFVPYDLAGAAAGGAASR